MRSLRNKLWLGFGSLSMILVVVGALSVIVLARYSHTLERALRENYDSAIYCDGMKDALNQLNGRAQQMIWDAASASAIDTSQTSARFEQCLQNEFGNIILPGELETTQRIAASWKEYRTRYAAFDAATPAARPALYRQELLPRYESLQKDAQHIADMNVSSMVSVDGRARQTLLHVRSALLILMVSGVLMAGIVLSTATLTIFRPLNELTRSARQIESGDLDQELRLPSRTNDEIGTLTDAFTAMAARLREFKRIDQDRLLRTQQTTQLAIDSLPDPVFVIGPTGIIELANAAAQSHLNIKPAEAIAGLPFKWLLPLYEEVKLNDKAVESVSYRESVQIFINGEERFLLPKAVPMLSSENQPAGVTVILVDVTRFRQMDEAKSGLVSTVSHELRTPLTSQRLVLGLLLETVGPTLQPNQRRLMEVAKADSDRLYRTIEDLLNISRIEAGQAQYQFRPMQAREIVEAAVDPLRALFTDKQLVLTVDVGGGLPAVRADAASISSALANLVSNALKFTPPGGSVGVSAQPGQGGVIFTVTDTGPGVPEQFRQHLFQKFFRVPISSGPTGAGLGLSIAKQIVDGHAGRIDFTCPPHGGTVVRVWLAAM